MSQTIDSDISPPDHPLHGNPRFYVIAAGLLTLCVLLVLSLGWVGHLGSDDLAYVTAALNWFRVDSYLPGSHWAMRHSLNLPMGVAFQIFGGSEAVSILPSLLYALCLMCMLLLIIGHKITPLAGLLAGLAFALMPMFAEMASIANVDIVEAFFVFASFFVFCAAYGKDARLPMIFACGVLAGLAFMARETAGALVVFYGVLFLVRPGMARWRYIIMGVGFCLVVGGEMAYYAVVTGEPLHRFIVALGTVDAVNPTDPGTGNITTNRWLGPFASVLVNNEFGLLFWLAALAAWLGLRKADWLDGEQRRFLVLLLAMASAWFIVIGYCLDLRALPRYFVVPAVTTCIFLGLGLYGLLVRRRVKTAALLAVLFAVSSLALVDLSNQQILLPEKTAVSLLRDGEVAVLHTDPRIVYRSGQLMEWAGVAPDRLSYAVPQAGDHLLYFASSAAQGQAGPLGRFDPADYTPQDNWQAIETIRGRPTLIGRVLRLVGLDGFLEENGLSRVIWETAPVVIYRVGEPAQP